MYYVNCLAFMGECIILIYNGVWCYAIRYDTIRYDTIRYDTIRYDTIRYDTIRYDTIRYDTIRYDTIRYDTIRYDTIRSIGLYIFLNNQIYKYIIYLPLTISK